jgi:hypothetical protein
MLKIIFEGETTKPSIKEITTNQKTRLNQRSGGEAS